MKVSLDRFLVPYDGGGNLCHSMPTRSEGDPFASIWDAASQTYIDHPIFWTKNEPFFASLTLDPMPHHRGLKAKYVYWQDRNGRSFPMFANNLADAILITKIDHGKTDPIEWVVRKHGREFGILPYEA